MVTFKKIQGCTFALLIAALSLTVLSGCNWTKMVSVDSAGNPGNFSSSHLTYPAISADGRYVAFTSFASNLVAGDTNGLSDIFVRDLLNETTTRVSVDSLGNQASGGQRVAISADGRYVAFESAAVNLVTNDTNGRQDVFLHDRNTGKTTRVSVGTGGVEGNQDSHAPAVSANGRYIVFSSFASNLVPGDTNNGQDCFLHDTSTSTTLRINVDSAGNQAIGSFPACALPVISADGHSVAFYSRAGNLVVGDTNSQEDVFVHNTQSGATIRVSVDSSGGQGNGSSSTVALSANGHHVVFTSNADNLVAGDTNGTWDIFMHDIQNGTTIRASIDSAGNQGNGSSVLPSVSADGRYVVFNSLASNLVSGDSNGTRDNFLHDTETGATTRISVDSSGVQGSGDSHWPALSDDGRYVAFGTEASDLVPGDINFWQDVIIRAIPELSVTGVTPSQLPIGTTSAVTITGKNFISGSTPTLDANISNIVVVDEATITMDAHVPLGTVPGARDVTVYLPGTGPGQAAGSISTCENCVTFIPGC